MTATNTKVLLNIDAQWQLVVIDELPQFARADGKYFSIQFDNSHGYFQPVVRENADASGFCGSVLPLVRFAYGEWEVLVACNKRIGDGGSEMLFEASRASVDNKTGLASGKYAVSELGSGRCNSARIIGTIRCGVVDVSGDTGSDYMIPPNGKWMTFSEFAKESSDMMAQAVLFRFLCEQSC